jgi:hypothetical protein
VSRAVGPPSSIVPRLPLRTHARTKIVGRAFAAITHPADLAAPVAGAVRVLDHVLQSAAAGVERVQDPRRGQVVRRSLGRRDVVPGQVGGVAQLNVEAEHGDRSGQRCAPRRQARDPHERRARDRARTDAGDPLRLGRDRRDLLLRGPTDELPQVEGIASGRHVAGPAELSGGAVPAHAANDAGTRPFA